MNPIQTVIENQQQRAIRSTPVEIITITKARNRSLAAAVPGSIIVLVAPKATGFIGRYKQAIKSGGAALTAVSERLYAQYSRKGKPLTLEQLANAIVRQPVYADIVYLGQRLCSGVFVPKDLDAFATTLPYNGGAINSKGLSLIEHWNENSDAGLEAVALRIDPELTESEKAALRLVPSDQVAKNVGVSIDCDTTWIAVAAVLGCLAGAGVIALATAFCGVIKDVHVSEAALAKMSPTAAARKLVALRREALQEGWIR
ncbi:MAG TPA: hypothetical protein VGL42_06790 [Opitutaceae bacterium]|jgi:hypothetical protein